MEDYFSLGIKTYYYEIEIIQSEGSGTKIVVRELLRSMEQKCTLL